MAIRQALQPPEQHLPQKGAGTSITMLSHLGRACMALFGHNGVGSAYIARSTMYGPPRSKLSMVILDQDLFSGEFTLPDRVFHSRILPRAVTPYGKDTILAQKRSHHV